MTPNIRAISALLCVVLMCCAEPKPVTRVPDARSGYEPPNVPQASAAQEDKLWQAANQVFERRCVVCHGCYDAPCQLKLESFDGVERGASPAAVYDGARLIEADPTRLFIDARSPAEWRAKGFHSVLPDRLTPQPQRSVMMRMLELKKQHPLTEMVDLDQAFTFALDREQTCTDAEHFDEYAQKHPLWGMPYGLPQIEPDAHAALSGWLAAGAPAGKPAELSPVLQQAVARASI
jgi:hypothetical protein